MEIHQISCKMINCFIIEDGEDAILVDTGIKRSREKVEEICKKYSIGLIVLTHGHYDHVENALYLSKKLHVPIAMHKLDYELIENQWAQNLHTHTVRGQLLLKLSSRIMKKSKIPFFKPDFFLKNGQSLQEFGMDATVIRLSGHTKGSIGIKVGMTDFIVGDALMNFLIPSTSLIYENREKAVQSAQIISQSGKRRIHFGHGKCVMNQLWK